MRLELSGPSGERFQMALTVDEDVVAEIERIDPPALLGPMPESLDPVLDVVRVLRRREFRKSLFMGVANKLGRLLAERMEDAEGWHDLDRQGPARRQLRGDGFPE